MKLQLNTPHFQETSGASRCGPAALKIVLKYFGTDMSETKLARLCNTTRALGTSGEDLARGAKRAGFAATIKDYATFKDIEACLKAGVPPIVDWFSPGDAGAVADGEVPDGHYSAVCALTKTLITLEDPEIGKRRSMTRKDFMRVWFDFDSETLRKPSDIIIRRLIMVKPKKV